jgi:hypothetical protein
LADSGSTFERRKLHQDFVGSRKVEGHSDIIRP